MAKSAHPQNKLIQVLTLAILVLGLGTSAFLVQQKINNSKAAVQAPPPPVCTRSGEFWCGGCVNGCINTGGRTCSVFLQSYCQPTQTCQIGLKRCSGNTVQTCLPPGTWSNTQTCSTGQNCSNGNCVASAGTPTLNLTASLQTITPGGSIFINWSSSNATSCTASASPSVVGWSGAKNTSGSFGTILSQTSTFILTCSGPNGSVTKSTTVTATTQGPTLTFTASPTSILPGGSTTLVWASSNATNCYSTSVPGIAEWNGYPLPSGNKIIKLEKTTVLSLRCSGPTGEITKSVTVSMPAPTLSFTTRYSSVNPGGPTTLSWSSTNTTACYSTSSPVIGDWNGYPLTTGSQSININQTQLLNLKCSGPGGEITRSLVVTVVVPECVEFTDSCRFYTKSTKTNIPTELYAVATCGKMNNSNLVNWRFPNTNISYCNQTCADTTNFTRTPQYDKTGIITCEAK